MAGFGGITTRKDLDGSRYEWVLAGPRRGTWATGPASACIIPTFKATKGADMHAIIGTSTNQDETWFNECSVDAEREDPGGISDPDLPSQPPAEAVTGCVSGTGPSSPSDFAGHTVHSPVATTSIRIGVRAPTPEPQRLLRPAMARSALCCRASPVPPTLFTNLLVVGSSTFPICRRRRRSLTPPGTNTARMVNRYSAIQIGPVSCPDPRVADSVDGTDSCACAEVDSALDYALAWYSTALSNNAQYYQLLADAGKLVANLAIYFNVTPSSNPEPKSRAASWTLKRTVRLSTSVMPIVLPDLLCLTPTAISSLCFRSGMYDGTTDAMIRSPTRWVT
jgi:hypothetical protein